MRIIILALFMCVTAAVPSAYASGSLTTNEKILLQATMQRSIASHIIDGKYFYFDTSEVKVQSIFPVKTHPMILHLGPHFILCTNFRSSEGKPVNVDFYIARQGDSFVVFDTIIANRAPIKQLLQNGQAHVVK